jgi:hypothetical protein
MVVRLVKMYMILSVSKARTVKKYEWSLVVAQETYGGTCRNNFTTSVVLPTQAGVGERDTRPREGARRDRNK